MMNQVLVVSCVLMSSLAGLAADLPQPIASGMKNPESVCIGADGRTYVTEIGEFGKDGDGRVLVIVDGMATPFATGLNDPKGIVAFEKDLYVTDQTRVVKVDAKGQVTTFAATDQFPLTPLFLNDIAVELKSGSLFVSDSGDLKGMGGAVFKIDMKSGKVNILDDAKSIPGLNTPNGLALDGATHLLLVDFGSGALYRIQIADKSFEKINEGFDGGDGLTWGKDGSLLISSWKTGKVFKAKRPDQKAVLISDRFEQAADSCLDPTGRFLLVPDMKAGTLTALPIAE